MNIPFPLNTIFKGEKPLKSDRININRQGLSSIDATWLNSHADVSPATLNEAIERIVSQLTIEERNFIQTNDQMDCHFPIGLRMRNSWNLHNRETPLNKDVQRRFRLFGNADDVNGLILDGVWAKVRGMDVNSELENTAAKYIAYWRKNGINPRTGAKV